MKIERNKIDGYKLWMMLRKSEWFTAMEYTQMYEVKKK